MLPCRESQSVGPSDQSTCEGSVKNPCRRCYPPAAVRHRAASSSPRESGGPPRSIRPIAARRRLCGIVILPPRNPQRVCFPLDRHRPYFPAALQELHSAKSSPQRRERLLDDILCRIPDDGIADQGDDLLRTLMFVTGSRLQLKTWRDCKPAYLGEARVQSQCRLSYERGAKTQWDDLNDPLGTLKCFSQSIGWGRT